MNTNPHLLKTFKEKTKWFLEYIYEHGGSEYRGETYYSDTSAGIPAAESPDEFNRMIESLKDDGWVTYLSCTKNIRGFLVYTDLKLTSAGIKEVERNLRPMPMLGLINQEITTGVPAVDEKIRHAKNLLITEPRTLDNMRSACETLSYVLEPMRSQLTTAFTDADVNAFFQLVNTFDIRHNKASTNKLQHEEQLEWVFYTLLNSINTYTKLKAKLGL